MVSGYTSGTAFCHVPLWGIAVELRYAQRRVSCPRREGVHVESTPWVSGKQQMTQVLMVTLATWARALPWPEMGRPDPSSRTIMCVYYETLGWVVTSKR